MRTPKVRTTLAVFMIFSACSSATPTRQPKSSSAPQVSATPAIQPSGDPAPSLSSPLARPRIAKAPDINARTIAATGDTVFYSEDLDDFKFAVVSETLGQKPKRIFTSGSYDVAYLEPGFLINTEDRRPEIGQGDFAADPFTIVYDRTGSKVTELGRAVNVEVSPDSTRAAWLKPQGVQTCDPDEGEECEQPPTHIHLASTPNWAGNDLGDALDVTGLLWLDNSTLLGLRDSKPPVSISESGSMTEVGIRGRLVEVRAGRMLVRQSDSLVVLDREFKELWRYEPQPGYSATGKLSNDGTKVLIAFSIPRSDMTADTRLRLDTIGGTSEVLSERQADGEMLWSADGGRFSYRKLNEKMDGFELVVCQTPSPHNCKSAKSWTTGLQFLEMK